ncbi:hypothetical protein L596_004290 [Steinernema carpocapsae]|uniref:Uncharacterized protein n=1 Tax=Steinernema carpocapsae TaxID=34508 RepID=A0A4U8UYW5_STECR|nr:hypothetical protein L596_004290 [Steinernema carpocapsae]
MDRPKSPTEDAFVVIDSVDLEEFGERLNEHQEAKSITRNAVTEVEDFDELSLKNWENVEKKEKSAPKSEAEKSASTADYVAGPSKQGGIRSLTIPDLLGAIVSERPSDQSNEPLKKRPSLDQEADKLAEGKKAGNGSGENSNDSEQEARRYVQELIGGMNHAQLLACYREFPAVRVLARPTMRVLVQEEVLPRERRALQRTFLTACSLTGRIWDELRDIHKRGLKTYERKMELNEKFFAVMLAIHELVTYIGTEVYAMEKIPDAIGQFSTMCVLRTKIRGEDARVIRAAYHEQWNDILDNNMNDFKALILAIQQHRESNGDPVETIKPVGYYRGAFDSEGARVPEILKYFNDLGIFGVPLKVTAGCTRPEEAGNAEQPAAE